MNQTNNADQGNGSHEILMENIAARTAGDVFIGVVGPVRTGKSTFIKKFMELLVLPRITDEQARMRAQDELPQSGVGRTVMTVEPKFIPDEAVAVEVREGLAVRIRLADSVGFPVEGARGYEEEEGPRMVVTPWFDEAIPFEEAAETGTRKIITDHSTMGIVVTSDGSFGELPRDAFVPAEQRTIAEIKELHRPFVIILNTTQPEASYTVELAAELTATYEVPVLPLNLAEVEEEQLYSVLQELLYEFPVTEFNVHLPSWVRELEGGYWLRQRYEAAINEAIVDVSRLRDADRVVDHLNQVEYVEKARLDRVELATGVVDLAITSPEDLFWQVAEDVSGFDITGKDVLLRLLRELGAAKKEHDKVGGALKEVRETGFGVVIPSLEDMVFEEPELIRKGNQFGVRLRAHAPALQFMRADIGAEVTPLIGTEKQSEQLVNYLMEKFEDDPRKIWESDIFGKPLSELLQEGIHEKIQAAPKNAQAKLRETIERIINEGSGGLICIII